MRHRGGYVSLMSQTERARILAAAHRLRERSGAGFTAAQLARAAGLSRATLYRRLRADASLARDLASARGGATDSRAALLDAARSLLQEEGLSGFAMESVAERAGLSSATLYRHFPRREDLLREVLQGALQVGELAKVLREGSADLEATLTRFAELLLSRMREQGLLLALMLRAESEELRVLRAARRGEERLSEALRSYFERPEVRRQLRPVPSVHLFSLLLGMVLGSVVSRRFHSDAPPPDARELVRTFLYGVRS